MSLIVLDIEITEKNINEVLGIFIDGSLYQKIVNIINRQRGTQILYIELRGVLES